MASRLKTKGEAKGIGTKATLLCIRAYQKTLSFDHGIPHKLFPALSVCIFEPTCSEYTYQAVDRYGVFRGSWLGFKRILRCGPWSYNKPHFDPVP